MLGAALPSCPNGGGDGGGMRVQQIERDVFHLLGERYESGTLAVMRVWAPGAIALQVTP